MSHPLLDCERVDRPAAEYLPSAGAVFAEFGPQAQDSGNVSYGVRIGAARFFVKTAGDPTDSRPFLGHADRVALLRNAIHLHGSVQHPLLPGLLRVIESPDGPLLVYPWLEGELLGVPRERRDDPQSSFQRFRSLPLPVLLSCLDSLYDLHTQVARAGWVAGDFYDGSLLYDFAASRLWAVDLDNYRDSPFVNDMGRMFGSSRFMAPEEFERGARIDEQTMVFVMGRTALVFLSDGSRDSGSFRGPRPLFDVVTRACAPARQDRYGSMADFSHAWRLARTE